MRCPHCAQSDTRVIDSRPAEGGGSLRRRRQCDHCGHRFTTHERLLQPPLIIVKKDGRREEFSADKLRMGIAKACNKRPVATDAIDRAVQEVEAALRQEATAEVSSTRLGEMVMAKLFTLDQVAYVRFASVYQCFDDVKRFAQLLERMSRPNRRRSGRSRVNETSAEETSAEETSAEETSAEETSTNEVRPDETIERAPGKDAERGV